jgi:hypothetical protein
MRKSCNHCGARISWWRWAVDGLCKRCLKKVMWIK